jgi:hypothetical protein
MRIGSMNNANDFSECPARPLASGLWAEAGVDNRGRHSPHRYTSVPRIAAEHLECLTDRHSTLGGQDAFGLLNDDAADKCLSQLPDNALLRSQLDIGYHVACDQIAEHSYGIEIGT